MKSAKEWTWSAAACLLAAVLIGLPGPLAGTAFAVVNCNSVVSTDITDTDGDGIPDYYECIGFTFYRGGTTFTGFKNKTLGAARSTYLDPDSKDLFLVVSRSSPSSLIPNSGNTADNVLFQDIVEPTGSGGLGTTLHYLADCSKLKDTTCATSRQLSTSFGQWAARVIEESSLSDTTPTGTILGNTIVGTPNTQPVEATVYTLRIRNFTRTNVCDNTDFTSTTYNANATFTCYDSYTQMGRRTGVLKSNLANDTTVNPLIDLYQRQNVTHESGHMMNLIQNTGATTTPPHYASSETGSIMESSVYYKRNVTKSSGKITSVEVIWYMPGSFVSTDVSNMNLK